MFIPAGMAATMAFTGRIVAGVLKPKKSMLFNDCGKRILRFETYSLT